MRKVYTYYPILVISFLCTMLNLITIGQFVGSFVSLIQYCIVISLLFKNKTGECLFWHLFFMITSISAISITGMAESGPPIKIYNYVSLKCIGPISFAYILSIIIFFRSLFCRQKVYNKDLTSLFKILVLLAIFGNILGIIGFCFKSGYYLPDFIKYNIYIWMTIITLYSIIKLLDPDLIKMFYISAIPTLSGAIFASLLGFYIGIKTTYGGVEIPYTTDICYFGPLILFAWFYIPRHRGIIGCAIIAYAIILSKAMGGKMVFFLAIAILYLVYLVFYDQTFKKNNKKYILTYRSIICATLLVLLIEIPLIMSDTTALTTIKINAAMSMFSGDITDVSNSPATRIAEIANFYYNNRYNPVNLLFGNGYGGYFTDELGLLAGLDLSGGWSEEVIRSGRFSSAHDTFSIVPLFNGVIGFILIMIIGLRYLKQTKDNYLSFAAVPWLIFTFYFNPLISFCSLFFLTGATYKLNYN